MPGNCPPDPTQGQLSKAQVLHVVQKLRSWAPSLLRERPDDDDVQPEIESVVQWLLNIRAALVSSGHRCHDRELLGTRKVFQSVFLVRCMLLTRLIPAYIPLKEICVPALQLLLPNLLSQATIDRLMAAKNLFPGGSSRHMLRLVLDVALLLWVRSQQVESNASYVRFTGADASPQCGYNWLLSNSVSVRVDMLPQLYGAAQRMITDCRQRTAVPDDVLEQSEQSISDHELIAQHVRQLHDVPVALGNAAASTGHKCAAMLHKWGLIVKERGRLRSYTSSVFSFCATWAPS